MLTVERARHILGVTSGATADQIRAAWKVKAKRFHPDQTGGSSEQFLAITEAYKRLKSHGIKDDAGFARAERKPSRRKPQTKRPVERRGKSGTSTDKTVRKVIIDGALKAACRARQNQHLARTAFADASRQNGGFYVDPRTVAQTPANVAHHIADQVVVRDGRVEVIVTQALKRGRNTLTLPDGTRETDKPAHLNFNVSKSGSGRITLDPKTQAVHFPWARSVEIVFTQSLAQAS